MSYSLSLHIFRIFFLFLFFPFPPCSSNSSSSIQQPTQLVTASKTFSLKVLFQQTVRCVLDIWIATAKDDYLILILHYKYICCHIWELVCVRMCAQRLQYSAACFDNKQQEKKNLTVMTANSVRSQATDAVHLLHNWHDATPQVK